MDPDPDLDRSTHTWFPLKDLHNKVGSEMLNDFTFTFSRCTMNIKVYINFANLHSSMFRPFLQLASFCCR
jgi:hypothetical protein